MSKCSVCNEACAKGKGNGRFCSLHCRFFSKVYKTNFCWIWKGGRVSNRYGGTHIGKKHILAHRASWEMHFGKINDKLHVLHRCDNGFCVNSEHLFLGTHQDNMDDKAKKRRVISNPYRKIPISEHENIINLFKSGKSQKFIYEKYNVNQWVIYEILKKYNAYEKRNPIIQPKDEWKVLSLFNDGFKRKEIAEMFECSEANIKRLLFKLRN